MRRVILILVCSSIMVLGAILSTLVVPKMAATAIGSLVASITLIKASLNKGASYGEMFSNGTAVAVLGSFLLNIVYYLVWGYIRELYGVRAALETLIMILKSGVFFYMFIVDLLIGFTSILLIISIVSLIYIGE
ncbi:MAG: hypothetical protein QW459_03745 [Sulfolobales archaeon]